jgi:hypothetical protein
VLPAGFSFAGLLSALGLAAAAVVAFAAGLAGLLVVLVPVVGILAADRLLGLRLLLLALLVLGTILFTVRTIVLVAHGDTFFWKTPSVSDNACRPGLLPRNFRNLTYPVQACIRACLPGKAANPPVSKAA